MKYIDKNKLNTYGFKNNILKKELSNKFKVIIKYNNKDFDIKVYDEFNEEYLPFYIKDNIGTYVSNIKEEVNNIINDIYSKCSIKNNVEEQLLKYVKDKYNTIPIKPFKNDNISTVLKNDKGKWYGLIMEISTKKLGLEKEELVKILNIKLDSEYIEQLIDNINYFKAYHMSKKYWISIILDSNLDINKLKELINMSYELVK